MTSGQALRCGDCGTDVATGLLSCPGCGRLVHSDKLKQLAVKAGESERNGQTLDALTAWREVIAYLPAGTRQYTIAEQKIVTLSAQIDASGSKSSGGAWWKRASTLGPTAIVLALLSKGKFLLMGFTKIGTLFSFAVGLSVYWAIWGWQFALLFLLSIYIHEMGHVAALHRFGMPATAPMFIPGLGAYVLLKQAPISPIADARVGLAGPVWGLGASLLALFLFGFTGNLLWGAVARAGAWINLFNLLPVWQLDGSRGIAPLRSNQVWILAVVSIAMFGLVEDGMLVILAILLAMRASAKRREEHDPDWAGFYQFAVLIIALALLCLIPLPPIPGRS